MDESYFQPEELIKAWRKRAESLTKYVKRHSFDAADKAKYASAAHVFRSCARDLNKALRNKNVPKQ